jgi:hypothetical protein
MYRLPLLHDGLPILGAEVRMDEPGASGPQVHHVPRADQGREDDRLFRSLSRGGDDFWLA